MAADTPRPVTPHVLRAWQDPQLDPLYLYTGQTAHQLFETLDADSDGRVSLEKVADAWPLRAGASAEEARRRVRLALARIAISYGHSGPSSQIMIGELEFRDAVRLWHVTGGHIPSLRCFLLSAVAEGSASVTLSLLAAQAASLVCAAVAGPTATVWPRLAAVGGVGATVAITLFDGSCVKPLLRSRKKANSMPLGAGTRQMLFISGSLSTGLLLAPAVPVLAGTVGDAQTKGYGPLAVAGLAIVHAAAHATLWAVVPEQCLPMPDADQSDKTLVSVGPAVISSIGAGLVTAAFGTAVARAAKREGAIPSMVAAAGLLSVHAALITGAATRAHGRGLAEPLLSPMLPMKKLLAVGAWAMRAGSST